ncbi:acyl-CoA N-acyltransferase [Leucosporidium creatinivorum]|uniref:Acyl-CoA N-acyltransferase n=1 Tax=Leucosporidium creatinivorum TaxID=106004 RepID=A0A1Y2DUA3_9BASI|nr:acyl-CoA N-acyltransferase [Leucosporidium creatinivorum]
MPLNLYRPPPGLTAQDKLHETTPAGEYDLNFVFPVPEELRSEGAVLMKPLVPSEHAEVLFNQLVKYPDMFRYLPYTFTTLPQFYLFLESNRREPGTILFVVYDLSLTFPDGDGEGEGEGEGDKEMDKRRVAGFLGLIKGSEQNRSAELAHLNILPPFHRSHITTHTCSLLLQYLFSTLHLRRAQWYSNAFNSPSIAAAQRLGFRLEGEQRWERVLAVGKEGLELPAWAEQEEREMGRGPGRHSCVLGMGWDEWKEGGEEKVRGLMKREVSKRREDELKR